MEFWKKAFSDGDAPSFSRIGTAVLIIFAVFWVSWIVLKKTELPDLGELSLFVGILYGANVAGNVGKAFSK